MVRRTFLQELYDLTLAFVTPKGICWTGGNVEINCSEVIREISNYLDECVSPELRQQITAHLEKCSHCTAIWDGLRNTVILVGDTLL